MRRLLAPVYAAFFTAFLMMTLVDPTPANSAEHGLVALDGPPVLHTEPPSLPGGRQNTEGAVTSVALTSTDGTNVACPATIHVTATVAGTSGKYLHVVVRAYFNGAFVPIDGTQSLPDTVLLPDGTYSHSFAVSLPVLSGEQGDGIQLTAWQNGDAFPFTTAGTNAQFVPTCKAAPTPPPTATPVPPPNGRDLGIPTDLSAVRSAQTCQALILASTIGNGCASAVQKGDLVLAWSYKSLSHCAPGCVTPSGFVVERAAYEGGPFQAYQLVNYQTQTPESDGIIMSVPYATTFGQCYRVSALRGANDVGAASTPLCIKPDAVTLDPSGIYYAHRLEHTKSGALCSPDSNPIGIALTANVPSGAFVVGWRDRVTFSSALQCYEEYYDRYQGVAVFPLQTLPLKKIAHATLTATIASGAFNAGENDQNNAYGVGKEARERVNCIAHGGFPTNYKPGGTMPEQITYDDAVDTNPGGKATSVSIDVTGMVRAWLNPGGINNGLVLSAQTFNGGNGYSKFNDMAQVWNAECLSLVSDPKLVITY